MVSFICHPIHTIILAKVDSNIEKKWWFSLGEYLFVMFLKHSNSVLQHSSVFQALFISLKLVESLTSSCNAHNQIGSSSFHKEKAISKDYFHSTAQAAKNIMFF